MRKSKMNKYQRMIGVSIVDGQQFPGMRKKAVIVKSRPRESHGNMRREEDKE